MFTTAATTLVSRLIAGQYPPFERHIPTACTTKLTIPVADFQQALRRALIESGLGSGLSDGAGFSSGRRETTFAAGLKGLAVEKAPRVEALVLETLAQVRSDGGDGVVIARDLSVDTAAEEVFQLVARRYGRADILVHAAGVGYSWMEKSPGSMNDVADTTPEKWREVIRINLDACYLACRAAVPRLRTPLYDLRT